MGTEFWTDAGPGAGVELIGQEFEFNAGLAFGVEVTAGIAAEVFDQVIDALRQVGGADLFADGGAGTPPKNFWRD